MLKNRRGVSAVISNLILVGAVISVGFIVLAWSQYQATSYNNQYGIAIQSDTDQLRERIAFEYINYDANAKVLKVYLMNSGTIGDVRIATVYINNTSYASPSLYSLNDSAMATPISSLNATKEGYLSIPSLNLAQDMNYPIKIVTGRGSNFVATFAT
jgi:uncharacterized protein YpmS